MSRRILIILTLGAIGGIIALQLNPVNSTLLNLAFLGCCMAAWSGLLMFGWRWKAVRISLFAVPLLFAILFCLPAREIDRRELRDDYLSRLMKFEGTRYYWGGENGRGIDCSGLPRRALRDALFSYGIRHANGGAMRSAIENWWFDASAKAVSEGYRAYALPLEIEGIISEMDFGDLLHGDMAITDGGAHMLAYAGEGRWIQADPGLGSVAFQHGKNDPNSWFSVPVGVYRWSVFAEEE